MSKVVASGRLKLHPDAADVIGRTIYGNSAETLYAVGHARGFCHDHPARLVRLNDGEAGGRQFAVLLDTQNHGVIGAVETGTTQTGVYLRLLADPADCVNGAGATGKVSRTLLAEGLDLSRLRSDDVKVKLHNFEGGHWREARALMGIEGAGRHAIPAPSGNFEGNFAHYRLRLAVAGLGRQR